MKKIIFTMITVTVIIGLILAGCANVFEPPASAGAAANGKGYASLKLSVANGRTLLPSTPLFDDYELTFTDEEGTEIIVTEVDEKGALTFELDPGTYSLDAKFYIDGEEVAVGTASDIVIVESDTTSIQLDLIFISDDGEGTFKWDIDLDGAEIATLTATPLSGGAAALTIDLTDTDNTLSSETLDAGFYLVTVALQKNLITATAGAEVATWVDILHVYKGQETKVTLGNDDFKYSNNIDALWVNSDPAANGEEEGIFTYTITGAAANDIFTINLTNGTGGAVFIPAENEAEIDENGGTFSIVFSPYGADLTGVETEWTLSVAGDYELTVDVIEKTLEVAFILTRTVTFNKNGADSADISPALVSDGKTLSGNYPTAPTKAGYVFDGWWTSGANYIEYFSNTPVTSDLTLIARWVKPYTAGEDYEVPMSGVKIWADLNGTDGQGMWIPLNLNSNFDIDDYTDFSIVLMRINEAGTAVNGGYNTRIAFTDSSSVVTGQVMAIGTGTPTKSLWWNFGQGTAPGASVTTALNSTPNSGVAVNTYTPTAIAFIHNGDNGSTYRSLALVSLTFKAPPPPPPPPPEVTPGVAIDFTNATFVSVHNSAYVSKTDNSYTYSLSNYDSAVKFKVVLPENTSLADYQTITFTVAGSTYKPVWVIGGKPLASGQIAKTSNVPDANVTTKNNQDNNWDGSNPKNLTFDIVDNNLTQSLTGEIELAVFVNANSGTLTVSNFKINPPPQITSFPITIQGAAGATTSVNYSAMTKVGGQTVTPVQNGYILEDVNYNHTLAYFTVNLGNKTVSDFSQIKFDLNQLDGDAIYKTYYALAAEISNMPSAGDFTASNYYLTSASAQTGGYGASSITLDIDGTQATALANQSQIGFAIWANIAGNGSGEYGSNTNPTRYQITNIVFVPVGGTPTVTSFDFKTNPDVTVTYAGTGTITASVVQSFDSTYALRVTKTNTNNSTAMFVLPFDLGETKLNEYSSVEVWVRGVRISNDTGTNDLGSKVFRVEAQPEGTAFSAAGNSANIQIGNINANIPAPGTINTTGTYQKLTLPASGGISSTLGGKIQLAFSLNNTQGFTIEIESITLVPNP